MSNRKIGLDIQALQTASADRGIGRYIRNFLGEANEAWGTTDLVLIVNGHESMISKDFLRSLRAIAPSAEIALWHPYEGKTGGHQEQTLFRTLESLTWAKFLDNLDLDAFLIMSPFEGFQDQSHIEIPYLRTFLVAAIIYDFIPLQLRSEYLDRDIRYKAFYFERLSELSHLDVALSLSEAEQSRARRVLGSGTPVHVIGAGVDSSLVIANPIDPHDKTDFLVVGGADSRKNLDLIVKAFGLAWKEAGNRNRLTIVGDVPGEMQRSLLSNLPLRMRLQNRIVFAGQVSDRSLSGFYRKSLALVFASQNEGFGLPIVEAMSAGLFVICSNSDTSREILGADYLGLFNPSVEDLARKMIEVIRLKESLADYVPGFQTRLENYSWTAVADKTLDLLGLDSGSINHADLEVGLGLEAELKKTCADFGREVEAGLLPTVATFLAKNLSQARRRRIFVDVSEIAHRDAATGIQRVVRNLLAQFSENFELGYDIAPVQGNQVVSGYFHSSYGATKFQSENRHLEDQAIEYVPGDIFLGLDLQHYMTIRNKTTFERMQLNGVIVVFVLYDLLPIQFPDFWPKEFAVAKAHVEWLRTISGADAVVAISKAVSTEYRNWLDNQDFPDRPQTGWFHIGSDLEGIQEDITSTFLWPTTGVRFLMVGTLEPRKGHGQTLDAFEKAWQQNAHVQLTIVGKPGWLCDDLVRRIKSHDEYGGKLRWLEKVPDSELSAIYSSADAVIASSFGEGFGLPIVEAGFHGKQTIARDIPVFREVSPPDALFFTSPDDLAMHIIAFKRTTERSQESYQPLTWRESSQALLKVLDDLNLLRLEKNRRV